jgi:cbb3-type cytochrome oxidase subunit 1
VRNLINIALAATMILFAVMLWGQVGLIAGAVARSKTESSAVTATPYLPFHRLEPIH